MKNSKIRNIGMSLALASLLLIGCEDGSTTYTKTTHEYLEDSFAYRTDGVYSGVLKKCAEVYYEEDLCSLNTLPLLGQEKSIPTKDMIMQRVLVSHKWMGDRFAQMLDVLDDDIKVLLANTRVIIIDSDMSIISYPGDGMINIPAEYLWMTSQESQTLITSTNDNVNTSDTSVKKLQFESFGIWSKDNKKFNISSNNSRSTEDVKYHMAYSLYFVLALAKNVIPKDGFSALNKSKSLYSNYIDNESDWISTRLYNNTPLISDKLIHLSNVYYTYTDITEEDKTLNAEDVGKLFQDEGASLFYGYYHKKADMVELFSATMLKYHYNVDTDIGFTNSSDSTSCEDDIIGWGEYNRIASPLVKPRAEFVANEILPTVNWSEFFASSVGESRPMTIGDNTCNLWDSNQTNKRVNRYVNHSGNSIMNDIKYPTVSKREYRGSK